MKGSVCSEEQSMMSMAQYERFTPDDMARLKLELVRFSRMGGATYNDVIGLELQLVRFFHKMVLEEIQWNAWLNTFYLKIVKNAYCKWTIENRLSYISFENPGMRCAYIFLNTPCFSSTVAFHFHNLLWENHWLLFRALFRGTLSICCLGAGPAPELVAIAKVLELVLGFFRPENLPLTICATIVDVDPGWQQTTKWMTQNWWKYFNTSIVKLKVTFVQADLTQTLTEEVREAIGKSDIVTMVKFLSAVYGTEGRDKIPDMLQAITDCMPVDAVLFFMNCSRFNCDQALSDVIASGRYMSEIYGPVRDHVYRMSGPASEECFRFYFRYYGWMPPTPENKSYVTAWRKWGQRYCPEAEQQETNEQ